MPYAPRFAGRAKISFIILIVFGHEFGYVEKNIINAYKINNNLLFIEKP